MAKAKAEAVIETVAEPKVKVETEERYLRCDLSADEFSEKAVELTRSIDNAAGLEEEAKAIKTDLKARQDKAAAEVARLNNIVRNRYEMRQVDCEVRLDYDHLRVQVTRTDTGQVIDEREMKLHERERQAELFPPAADSEANSEAVGGSASTGWRVDMGGSAATARKCARKATVNGINSYPPMPLRARLRWTLSHTNSNVRPECRGLRPVALT